MQKCSVTRSCFYHHMKCQRSLLFISLDCVLKQEELLRLARQNIFSNLIGTELPHSIFSSVFFSYNKIIPFNDFVSVQRNLLYTVSQNYCFSLITTNVDFPGIELFCWLSWPVRGNGKRKRKYLIKKCNKSWLLFIEYKWQFSFYRSRSQNHIWTLVIDESSHPRKPYTLLGSQSYQNMSNPLILQFSPSYQVAYFYVQKKHLQWLCLFSDYGI